MALDDYMDDATQKMVRDWTSKVSADMTPNDAGMVLLLAELTKSNPEVIRLRLHDLRKQCRAVRYGTEYP